MKKREERYFRGIGRQRAQESLTRGKTRDLYRALRTGKWKTAAEARRLVDEIRRRALSGRCRWGPVALREIMSVRDLVGPRGGVHADKLVHLPTRLDNPG